MSIRKLLPVVAAWAGLFCALASGAVAQTLKIGLIAPLTGAGAPWGQAAAEGVKHFASEVNAKGGVKIGEKTYRLEIAAHDDRYMAADAVAAYNKLNTQDGVKFVFMLGSASTLAVKHKIEEDKVIVITGAVSDKIFEGDAKHMYRLFSNTGDYMPGVVKWIKDNYAQRRLVIVDPNDETGWEHSQLASRLFKENGFTLVATELFERTQRDFSPLITKILAMQPEMIELGSTSPATAGIFVRQARELGYKGLFLKTGGAGPKEIVAGAGKEAAEGAINVLYADTSRPGYQRLAKAYRDAVGQEPNEVMASYYDGITVLVRAIEKAGAVDDTAKVLAALPQIFPVKSVLGDDIKLGGEKTTGKRQTFLTPNYIGVIRNGEAVVVGTVTQ